MSRKNASHAGQPTNSGSTVGALSPMPTPSTPRTGTGPAPLVGINVPPAQNPQSRGSAPRQAAVPTIEEIRKRAFELYLARGNRSGTPESDWLQAERELRARAAR